MTDIKKVAKMIKEADNFTIASHVGPDGDALGSTLALGLALTKMGKKNCLAFGEASVNVPPQYKFLRKLELLKSYKECPSPEIFISLECPTMMRLGGSNKLIKKAKRIINIDHHGDNLRFGEINWIEENASSTCEMLFRLFKLLDVEIDIDIASNLYVGIVTDTGRFQYSNINASTFEAAAFLIEKGVDANQIFQNVYENRSFNSTVLLGEVLARAKFIKDIGFVYSTIQREDFGFSRITIGETEHFIDALRAVKDSRVAAIFKEVNKNEIKISLRSRENTNVAKIAERLGGGGHVAAAGYTSNKTLDEAIQDLTNILKKQ